MTYKEYFGRSPVSLSQDNFEKMSATEAHCGLEMQNGKPGMPGM